MSPKYSWEPKLGDGFRPVAATGHLNMHHTGLNQIERIALIALG